MERSFSWWKWTKKSSIYWTVAKTRETPFPQSQSQKIIHFPWYSWDLTQADIYATFEKNPLSLDSQEKFHNEGSGYLGCGRAHLCIAAKVSSTTEGVFLGNQRLEGTNSMLSTFQIRQKEEYVHVKMIPWMLKGFFSLAHRIVKWIYIDGKLPVETNIEQIHHQSVPYLEDASAYWRIKGPICLYNSVFPKLFQYVTPFSSTKPTMTPTFIDRSPAH